MRLSSVRYVCDLSGESTAANTDSQEEPDDDLGDLPVGWARVLIERRVENPDHVKLQQTRAEMIQLVVTENESSDPDLARIMVDGQLAGALAVTPRWIVTTEEAVVAPRWYAHLLAAVGLADEVDDSSTTADPAEAPA